MADGKLGHGRSSSRAPGVLSLDKTRIPNRVEVVEVVGTTSPRRLARLGIRNGEILQVQRAAPMNGPILVEIQGSTVAVSRVLAGKVLVREV